MCNLLSLELSKQFGWQDGHRWMTVSGILDDFSRMRLSCTFLGEGGPGEMGHVLYACTEALALFLAWPSAGNHGQNLVPWKGSCPMPGCGPAAYSPCLAPWRERVNVCCWRSEGWAALIPYPFFLPWFCVVLCLVLSCTCAFGAGVAGKEVFGAVLGSRCAQEH